MDLLRPATAPLNVLDGVKSAGQITWDRPLGRFRVDVTDGERWFTQWTVSHASAIALLRTTITSLDTGVRMSDGRFARWSRSVPTRQIGGVGAA